MTEKNSTPDSVTLPVVPVELGLHAAVVAVDGGQPLVLTVSNSQSGSDLPALPFGPFDPQRHRTLEEGLRLWVKEQTDLPLGYVEQLYTFGDRDRLHGTQEGKPHLVSVGYLTLTRVPTKPLVGRTPLIWNSWYKHFPWEDWRHGPPTLLENIILPALLSWVNSAREPVKQASREARLRLAFGCDIKQNGTAVIEAWDEERVLERYELMYSAGLVEEALIDGRVSDLGLVKPPGQTMLYDHRRILATAIARLRAKLKYRPVVFELMPDVFTLTQLQQAVETLSGRLLHKQNFRRMVENAELVEPTGATSSQTGGRPAAYFRFRRLITRERPAPGLRV